MYNKPIVYTIGHSTHSLDYFIELLEEYGINCLADIRSVPESATSPQYNQEALKYSLKKNKIIYLNFGDEFGARQTDPNLLDNKGKLDFDKVRNGKSFKFGLDRIRQGVEIEYVIAIMCSESEPLDCHRFSMVSVGLEREGFEVRHILKDKTIKTNFELKKALVKKYDKKLPQKDLFNPDVTFEEQLEVAFRIKNKEIGYVPSLHNQKEEISKSTGTINASLISTR